MSPTPMQVPTLPRLKRALRFAKIRSFEGVRVDGGVGCVCQLQIVMASVGFACSMQTLHLGSAHGNRWDRPTPTLCAHHNRGVATGGGVISVFIPIQISPSKLFMR